MRKKFVGDRASLEASSRDGKRWEVTIHDRGHVTKYVDATEAEVMKLASDKRMRLVAQS